MTPTEVKQIVLSWLDYQDHDHTLPGHMGPERIEHFSRKMAEPEQAEPKPAELTADDFVRINAYDNCEGCHFYWSDENRCKFEDNKKLSKDILIKHGNCFGADKYFIFQLKEAAK